MKQHHGVFIQAALPLLVVVLAAASACAQRDPASFYPAEMDPLVGNWQGRWSADEDVNPDITAQVVPLGRDRYQIRLATKLFMRCPPLAIIEAKAEKGVLRFNAEGLQGEISNGKFTGARRTGKMTFEMTKLVYQPSNLGAAPPPNAEILFDGTNLDQWDNTAGWVITDDKAMMVTPDAGDLVSKNKYKDVQLHIEFRTPLQPTLTGQSRGNSGVFVQDVYEIQVLDSFGLEGYFDECGALYKVAAPQVNACLPPNEWQAYDITYHAARFDKNGNLLANPRMTVVHNGHIIHNDQELWWITAWKENERLQPPPKEAGAIKLQSHNSHYVQYRNIWLVALDAK